MNQILKKLRNELQANANADTKAGFQQYFKETAKFYGVKTGTVNQIARVYWKEVKKLEKQAIFDLCEELFRSDFSEEAFIVSDWVPKLTEKFEPSDLFLFKRWIDTYINNWAKCDTFCNHSVGNFMEKYPESSGELLNWATSANRWMKRAAAVSLIVPAKHGKFLPEVLQISDRLLTNKDDMVQKGYGWLLKEASRLHQSEVFQYVVKNKKVMPRTALRYAIELMPKELKTEAMKR